MMPILACLTSFLLAWACLSGVDFVVREWSVGQPVQHHATPLVAQPKPKPATPFLTHLRHRAAR